jgi:hypothetical protein
MAEDRDTFAAAIALIGLAVDPKATAARLAELRTAIEKAEASTAKLTADREQHAAAVAAAKAELDARRTALAQREVALAAQEGRQAHHDKLIAQWRAEHGFVPDPNLGPGGRSHSGLTREVGHG